MTTKELIQWVIKAQEFKEASWQKKEMIYRFNDVESLHKTKPENSKVVEFNIAYTLMYYYLGYCKEWIKQF